MLAAGVKLAVISKIVGHKNWSLTLDTYSDLLPEASRQTAEALDRFLAEHQLSPSDGPKNARYQSGDEGGRTAKWRQKQAPALLHSVGGLPKPLRLYD